MGDIKNSTTIKNKPFRGLNPNLKEESDRILTRPKSFQNLALKTLKGEVSPKSAIKAMCQHCLGYEEVFSGALNCKSYQCPLWAYRPYQKKNGEKK